MIGAHLCFQLSRMTATLLLKLLTPRNFFNRKNGFVLFLCMEREHAECAWSRYRSRRVPRQQEKRRCRERAGYGARDRWGVAGERPRSVGVQTATLRCMWRRHYFRSALRRRYFSTRTTHFYVVWKKKKKTVINTKEKVFFARVSFKTN